MTGPASSAASLPNGHSSSSSSHSSTKHTHGFSTQAIHLATSAHASDPAARNPFGGVSTPLDLSTTFYQPAVGQLVGGFEYARSGNPTRLALERVLAGLEGARVEGEGEGEGGEEEAGLPAALAFASGSAATATVVQALVGNGGHIVSVGDVYGGSSRYMLKVAGPLQGAETTFVDLSFNSVHLEGVDEADEQGTRRRQDEAIVERLEGAVRAETKVIWIETPTNPMLNLVPIKLVANFAESRSIALVVDNTFASPFFQQPLSLGATAVIGSSTKYLSGHSDVVGGYIATSDAVLLDKLRFLQNAHGAIASPFDSLLLIRSLKTLPLRMKQHSLNALAVARFLESDPRVRDVRYPGLRRRDESAAQKRERELAWEQLTPTARRWLSSSPLAFGVESEGGFPSGGMVSFHIRSGAPRSQTETRTAERFLEALRVFTLAESLGGVESLAELPIKMTHGGVDPTRRAELGIDGELVRLSVGIEDVEDLLADLDQALEKAVGPAGRKNGKVDGVANGKE